MAKRRIIVIGGGPAGLMAAGQAALAGAEVMLLEKMTRPGRKLSITGKGRCNLTNSAELKNFITHYGKNGKFLRQAFNAFFSHDLIEFLGGLDIQTGTERDGRIFPIDNDAPAVTIAMIDWIKKCKVSLRSRSPVEWLIQQDGYIQGVVVPREPKTAISSPLTKASTKFRTDGKQFKADAVIIATGGKSYPATGSTGDGYKLAEQAGHTIITPRPAHVPLVTEEDIYSDLAGLTLKNVDVAVYVDGKKQDSHFGELRFEPYGLSGAAVLSLSGLVVKALEKRLPVKVSIDLKPALDNKKLDARLLRELDTGGKKIFRTILKELLPQKLIDVCIQQTGILFDTPGHQITSEERKRLRVWLKEFQFNIIGNRSFKEALVTSGGVNLKEINPRTMESNKLKGLYFAGEILDIDGDTGGYNLQAAFSTGYLAGISATKG